MPARIDPVLFVKYIWNKPDGEQVEVASGSYGTPLFAATTPNVGDHLTFATATEESSLGVVVGRKFEFTLTYTEITVYCESASITTAPLDAATVPEGFYWVKYGVSTNVGYKLTTDDPSCDPNYPWYVIGFDGSFSHEYMNRHFPIIRKIEGQP